MIVDAFSTSDNIEAVIEKYQKMVFGIALSYTCNRVDADDVFQDVFFLYYQKNITFNDENHRKAWLINTAVNYSKKIVGSTWRKKTKQYDDSREIAYEFLTDDENMVFSALSELPQKYRVVLHLFYFQQMTIAEISNALNIKSGTIRVQLLRGRELIREKLKGDYFYE